MSGVVMKTLLLLRHGRSSWRTGWADDSERPLSERGGKDARRMGAFLGRLRQAPEQVLSSPAVRALDTVRLAAEAGGWRCPVETVPEFYSGSVGAVLDRVRRERDKIETLLLVGHQPMWSNVAAELVGGAVLRFPTSALVRIVLAVESWREIGRGRGELIWLVTPRMLK